MPRKKISNLELLFLSLGSMIGAGWLFAPYLGFKLAGIWVIYSWGIVAMMLAFIGSTFAEVASIFPIVGGVSRFMSITHKTSFGFLFLMIGWLSFVVSVPLDIQTTLQYMGIWFPFLIQKHGNDFSLSSLGVITAIVIMLLIMWLNTLNIKSVAKTNMLISIWKIIIPLTVVVTIILIWGHPANAMQYHHSQSLTFENVFLAITSCGMAFSLNGFQNGLVIANETSNPKKAIPISIFGTLILGSIIYMGVSLTFIYALPYGSDDIKVGIAPLLGLIALLGFKIGYFVLLFDAFLAPLAGANVYATFTTRVLYGLSIDYFPKSFLTKLNKKQVPIFCLLLNTIIGCMFLLPVPTWKQAVVFLSSLILMGYIAGPLSLLILRKELPHSKRTFKVRFPTTVSYIAFIFCTLLIYWSGLHNLIFLSAIILVVLIIFYAIVNKDKSESLYSLLLDSFIIFSFPLWLVLIAYNKQQGSIHFPYDNLIVSVIAILYCYWLVKKRYPKDIIKTNLDYYLNEVQNNII
ncbi:MAG: APC family permease [Phycisphaerales bacterium]|nr:APC family permease [Phycisphaerales bacterium]